MAIYAIGDIQGCHQQLEQLLKKIQFNQDSDQLWFTGDLVNRGPDSLETMRLIHSLRDNVTVVLGNHDLHLLATAYHHQHPGKKDTLGKLLNAPDLHRLLNWLRQQPLVHHDSSLNITMIHAGIHPEWTITKALSLASEIEAILQNNEKHLGFYQHMYGDKPHQWSDNLTSWPRLRFITNTLTRLRYCKPNGEQALNPKGAPGTQPAGLTPWYENAKRASRDSRIIFGHWSTLNFEIDSYTKHNVFPIDTGCLWGGKLTALRIDASPLERITLDCPIIQNPSKYSSTNSKKTSIA